MKKTSDDALSNFSYAIYHTSIYMSRRILQCILYILGAMSLCPRFLLMFFLGSWIPWMKRPLFNMSMVSFIPVPCAPNMLDNSFDHVDKKLSLAFPETFFTLIHLLTSMYSQKCTFFLFLFQFHTFIITFIQYIHPSPFAEASLHLFITCCS
jgi:hypothetical protein